MNVLLQRSAGLRPGSFPGICNKADQTVQAFVNHGSNQTSRQRLGLRQPSAAFPSRACGAKTVEGHRTPRPRGIHHAANTITPSWPSNLSVPTCRAWRPALLLALLLAFCGQLFAQSTNTVRFQTVEIFADSQTTALAAYQLEFNVTSGNAKIVGIEGGEHPAFAEAPFYDPKAIQHERVILAAFSTQPADKLPSGKTRVATIHLQISGADELKFETKLATAASSDGNKIAVTISATEKRAK